MCLALQRNPTQDKAQSILEEGEGEREKGIYIQRSRAAPPGEEEGEEEEELVNAAVLMKKETQPKLGSIVIQRFEYFVLWFGAVVLWCLSYSAQGLVNLLNSQVVCGVGCRAYFLGFFELVQSKRSESSCSSLYCTCASGSSVVRRWTVKCVDTVHGRVDTRPSLQKTQLPDWDIVSTQPVAVSTLDPVSRRPFLRNWDSVSTHSVAVSTHSS
ncbi:hypothetical protein Taro_024426 [Colocasia esculenta]|uniref:Uncharacterized protein n=1 Tax=Colocasia esculenta TaxID=4460 RepID=A0A843VDL9_COLES|nr:hypothetical protein [Colocasia esculenta]